MTRQSNRFNEVRRYVAGVDLAGNADHYVCGPRKDDGTHDIEHFGSTTNELLRMAVRDFTLAIPVRLPRFAVVAAGKARLRLPSS